VRIYRRDREDPESVAGVVESAEPDRSCAFHSVTELLQLLALARASPRDRASGTVKTKRES